MNPIWLQHYPTGVPASIATDAYPSIVGLLTESAARYGDAPACVNFGQAVSYAELDRLSQRFASFLQHEAGFVHGERFAVMMPNLLQFPVALMGCLRAGLIVVPVNPLYSPRELEHQLRDSGARGILVAESSAHTLAQIIDRSPVETVITTSIGEMLPWPRRMAVNAAVKYVKRMVPAFRLPGAVTFSVALREGGRHPPSPVPLDHDDIALLQYTGGTTGLAKGAILTHGNIVANVEQAGAWLAPWIKPGAETIITALPLYHIFALTANFLISLKIGARNVLITNPRDLRGLIRELRHWPFSIFTGVNTLFNGLLNTRGFDRIDFSHLKLSLGGGMSVQRTVAERWQAVTGRPIVEAYGLTEASPAVCVNPLDIRGYTGSIGMPLPSTECHIADDGGAEVAPGESGELCVRGPQVMRGYWNRPEETQAAFTDDGFLRTGDVARMDERGCFYIVDRKKDMILVSGFNVYPNEVEEVAVGCPGVLEAACVGVADPASGEAVKLVVVARPDASVTEDAIKAHCRRNLAAYKCPRYIEFRQALPKSQVGKILRRDLRDT